MKQWRSKYGRITESEIIKYLTEDGNKSLDDYFVLSDDKAILTIENQIIFYQIIEDDRMFLSAVQYLREKEINVFKSIEQLKRSITLNNKSL